MDTIVKYRFDREMVAFVKTLDIKTAMFGYDKNDVYSKIKDLLVRARDVCQDLVAEENEKFEAIKASLLQVADDPEAVRAILCEWETLSGELDAKASQEGLSEATPDLVQPEAEVPAATYSSQANQAFALPEAEVSATAYSSQENQAFALPEAEVSATAYSSQANQALEPAEVELPAATCPSQADQALVARLEELEARQELLDRAHDIVSEARLEREEIIRKAQTVAEEELFLYRAKRREEESEFLTELERLEVQKVSLEAACDRYWRYVSEGQSLFDQLQSYASGIDTIREVETMSVKKDDLAAEAASLDPPDLTVDRHKGCTEESMPLCELAEESPEGIFPDLTATQNPLPQDNEPTAGDPHVSCQGSGE